MSRARIEALAMVNWRGIFYERLLFDRAVTALEGTNGAGKTTVMVAVYVALFPELGKLRFTNLGEHDGRSGDRGIYGRLGDSAWPAFTVLDLRVGRDERVLAGVRITRKTEPSVELDPFIVTGLSPTVRLSDVLLDTDSAGQDRLLDRVTLNSRVALAGGEISWCTTSQYFRELFERGILPLRLSSEEDRRRFNHMLRTSMIGGISHTLSGGLRDFVLREDPSLAEGLRSMRDNLAACQSTRRQIEEEEKAETEVRGVYEAGSVMFAAGVHQHRITTDVRQASRVRAEENEEAAQRALAEIEDEKSAADLGLTRLNEEVADAQATSAELAGQVGRLIDALERARKLDEAGIDEAEKSSLAEAARARLANADEALRVATEGADRARRRSNDLAHQLSHQSEAFAQLSERAGLFRHAGKRLADLTSCVGVRSPALDTLGDGRAERFSAAARTLTTNVAELTEQIGWIDARLRDAAHHAEAHGRLSEALLQAEAALVPPIGTAGGDTDPNPHARAAKLLAQLPGWRSIAADADRLAMDAKRLAAELTEQTRVRSKAAQLLGDDVTGVLIREAWSEIIEREKLLSKARSDAQAVERELADSLAGQVRARQAASDEVPAWDGVAALARELARASGASLVTLPDLDLREDQWRGAQAAATQEAAALRTKAEAAERDAITLEQTASGLDPRLVAVAGAVGGEPLATWYDGLALEEAPLVEALLGPLRDAILVPDALAAAHAARTLPNVPPELRFLRSFPGERPPGVVVDGTVVVGDPEAARLTRVPERPVLGQAARRARVAALLAEAEAHSELATTADAAASRPGGWLADARRLRAEARRWLAPDPRRELQAIEADIAELGRLRQEATERCTSAAAESRACEERKAKLANLLPSAHLLDDLLLAERAQSRTDEARDAARLRVSLATASTALTLLATNIEPLRHPPLTVAAQATLADELAAKRELRLAQVSAMDAAFWLAEHADALDWGKDAEDERSAEEKLGGLRDEHRQAEAELGVATHRANGTREIEVEARKVSVATQGAYDQARLWRMRLASELEALGVGVPTEADVSAARASLTRAQATLTRLNTRRDVHQQLVGELGARVREATGKWAEATEEARDARDAETPAVAAWASLQDAATQAGVLADAYTESARARMDGRTAETLSILAGQQRVLLLDRLKTASRGHLVRQGLEERALTETPRWSDQLEDWVSVRAWLRERVPPQVSEADDPVRVLGDLARHLASLRQQLAAREDDLRVSSRSIANHLNTAIRTARSLVDRLQEGLEDIRFGSIHRIRVTAENIKPMARILDVLRSDAVQTTLFDAAPTLEQALERIYAQEAGGTIAGHRLLDYREYIDLRVSVKREGDRDWSEANAARMSTGEAIGVGAALMMVVLDAWEKRESLGRAKARHASLRFLFLDEASRLSVDVLQTLFELCDRLQLQMLVAAPEVPLSEGNITWRLERVNGKVLVTGRKVEA